MRFLGIGDSCDLGALYLRLMAEGHEVRIHIGEKLCQGTLAGMVARSADWRADLGWIRQAGSDGFLLFENVAEQRGALQDGLRREGFQVIGGSEFGDRLEKDRGFGQALLAENGLNITPTFSFDRPDQALAFLDRRPPSPPFADVATITQVGPLPHRPLFTPADPGQGPGRPRPTLNETPLSCSGDATNKQRRALTLFRGINVETAANLRAYCAAYRRLADHPFHKRHRELLLDLALKCETIADNIEKMARISQQPAAAGGLARSTTIEPDGG